MSSDLIILICTTCRGSGPASDLRRAIARGAPESAVFKAVDCLAACDAPIAVGLQGRGKASYLFGGIESDIEARAIATFAHAFENSATGWTSSQERPAALADKTLARLPGIALS
ncbi:DUF1636 family protein [Primorskyibacter sp. S187A]|uniref:DUF1636 family protein n=1 Tax=Primorskyibacter sp. S187A TaxID=3415130 RepID=UPI003C7BABAC